MVALSNKTTNIMPSSSNCLSPTDHVHQSPKGVFPKQNTCSKGSKDGSHNSIVRFRGNIFSPCTLQRLKFEEYTITRLRKRPLDNDSRLWSMMGFFRPIGEIKNS